MKSLKSSFKVKNFNVLIFSIGLISGFILLTIGLFFSNIRINKDLKIYNTLDEEQIKTVQNLADTKDQENKKLIDIFKEKEQKLKEAEEVIKAQETELLSTKENLENSKNQYTNLLNEKDKIDQELTSERERANSAESDKIKAESEKKQIIVDAEKDDALELARSCVASNSTGGSGFFSCSSGGITATCNGINLGSSFGTASCTTPKGSFFCSVSNFGISSNITCR